MTPQIRNRAARLLLLALCCGFLLIIVVLPGRAYACSCALERNDRTYFDNADAVFVAQLVSDSKPLGGEWRASSRKLVFEVSSVYKGSVVTRQTVTTASSGASCGLDIAGAGTYLVFGRSPDGNADRPGILSAGLCDGTRAGLAPASFGPGTAPAAGTTPTGPPVLRTAAIMAVVAATAGFLLSRRRRRPS